MLVLIIAIFALLRNSFGTTQVVYDPPISSFPWQNTTNTTTLNGGASYACNRGFGINLNAESCINAIEQIGLTDDTIRTYGYRDTREKYDYNVPQRWISSDALCAVNVDLVWGEPSSRSSERMIGQGAVLVLTWCVGQRDQENTGGVAYNLGGDNNLQVSLSQSQQTEICFGTMASTLKTSCAELVDNMPYDRIPQMFGLRGDPQADVPLPLTMTSSDGLCAMTISTLGPSEQSNWWTMWKAAVQLNGVCVKYGKKGKNPGIGEMKLLSIDVRGVWPGGGAGSNATVGSEVLNVTVGGEVLNVTVGGEVLNGTLGSEVLNGTVGSELLNGAVGSADGDVTTS